MDPAEKFNTSTHLFGAVLALIGAVLLVVFASMGGNPWKIVSFSIYGVTLFLLYLISTLYHGISSKSKFVFEILDHQAIYLLIAGTYTPFTLAVLEGGWAWSIFGVVWGLAVFGIVLDSLPFIRKGKRYFPVLIYILMGWIIIIALDPLLQNLPEQGFNWLLAGGVAYTVGIVFYAMSSYFTYAHGIWHLFVLAGSTCHYVSIFIYID